MKSIDPKSENSDLEEKVMIIEAVIARECFHLMFLDNTMNMLYEVSFDRMHKYNP
jgi:hypothetical protein